MVQNKANVNIQNLDGETPLMEASKWQLIPNDIIDLLLKNCDINIQDKKGFSALAYGNMFIILI